MSFRGLPEKREFLKRSPISHFAAKMQKKKEHKRALSALDDSLNTSQVSAGPKTNDLLKKIRQRMHREKE